MLVYLFKRLSRIISSLLILSLLIFGLSRLSPGDPIQNLLEEIQSNGKSYSIEQEAELIQNFKKNLGLDVPPFYFSLNRNSYIGNYLDISNPLIKANFNELAYQYGQGALTSNYYFEIKRNQEFSSLLYLNNETVIDSIINSYNSIVLLESWNTLKNNSSRINNYLPYFYWNGLKNQYHVWILNFIHGEFGQSYFDNKPISQKLGTALPWTLSLSLISILLALIIAIPTGVYAAIHKNTFKDKILNKTFFAFYSLPNFWLASLLVVFFTNPDHLNWFPSYGLGDISVNNSFFQSLSTRIHHLILPIIVWTYGSIAFIFRQVRSSMIVELESEYVKTALAKGLPFRTIVWKHAFKNASFPLITIIGSAVPAVFSGSFVVEYIFSIPGMGMLTIQSFTARDYPVIFSILMLMGVLTILGLFLADLLYTYNDPRIKLTKKKF
jgi:peptide/nickel transport system permease protein